MSAEIALIIIDVQRGFLDTGFWGDTANIEAENRVAQLAEVWSDNQLGPIVMVRHDSKSPSSPLHPSQPGNALMQQLDGIQPAVLITKNVNSAFYGDPDLHDWLTKRGISKMVICGIQTNMCVETTARMAGNLGYQVTVPLDATRTFGIDTTLADGTVLHLSADELMRSTAASLHGGGFATVTSTDRLISELGATTPKTD